LRCCSTSGCVSSPSSSSKRLFLIWEGITTEVDESDESIFRYCDITSTFMLESRQLAWHKLHSRSPFKEKMKKFNFREKIQQMLLIQMQCLTYLKKDQLNLNILHLWDIEKLQERDWSKHPHK
jgi:hypothetical protein